MYHAPVSPDASPEEAPLAEAPEEELSYEDGNDRLREAHLQNGQAEVTALFAPYLAVSGIGTALLAAWAMYGHTRLEFIIGWLAAVGFAHWVTYRKAVEAGSAAGSRSARRRPEWMPIAESVGLASIWSSLPAYAFATTPPDAQVVVGGAMGAMIVAAIAMAAVPRAALAWIGTHTTALCVACFFGSPTMDLKLGATIVGVGAITILGVARLTRWTYNQLLAVAKIRTQSESIRLLLREYEHRGVGWLWQVDSENRVVYISSRMTALLGRSTSQLIGHSLPASLGGNSALGRTLLARQPFQNLEMELRTRRGTRWISLAGDPIIDMAGQFQGFRGVGSDITEVRKTQERLTNLANMDVLSGLPNRGRVRQLLGEALSTAQATNVPCAIMFLDLDGFKPVNDTFGHPKGDAVLQAVAKRLCDQVGPDGHVGRMGGDEFAIVLADAQSRHKVEQLADGIIKSIAEPYMIDQTEIRIGVSIGCAFGPIDGATVDDLILKADLALYEAKGAGRGVVKYFSSELQTEQDDRVRLETDLRGAIASKQFHLVYQPLVNAKTQKLIGFEALIRWNHPQRGFVPPNIFIPVAEESGLMPVIGEWVIDEACRAAATWPEPITVALNISPKQILPALPNLVSQALGRHKLPANRVELEVTEGVFLGDNGATLDVLKRLRSLGVGIALDDFGTGYSSIGYLNKAVFHKLKIDGSFVREAGSRPENVAIIQSIVQLAKSFRMSITAEGVETAEDFERMRDLGCDTIQGYLFGRPLSYERANQMVMGLGAKRMAG